MDEPFGHRGHPSEAEMRRAARLAIYLERAIRRLGVQGFTEDEAVGFIAGLAAAHAERTGEGWVPGEPGAILTVRRMRDGHAAKEWSMDAIAMALLDVGDLTAE